MRRLQFFLKALLMRKEMGFSTIKDLEADDAEDEMELPPNLIFKRSRDVGF
jgi:hypothetical protein